ncbi:hypothetical protein GGR54DRAFT_649840 [Hypoxylon sp. NC1633]|nr:hypothetical protein GGR54DRAFT_649840 [Hypoxylon sp. NC1633]
MKITHTTVLGLAGLANAAKSFSDLRNGMYTIPIVNGTLEIAQAIRDDAPDAPSINVTQAQATSPQLTDLGADGTPGTCVPQFPTRKTECRPRRISRADFLRAYAKFLDWIEEGPDEGWVPRHSCKSLVWGQVVVSACTSGGANPTCRDELVEAMRELDAFCALDQGGDIRIRRWKKQYSRHHIRDGDLDILAEGAFADFDDADADADADEVDEVDVLEGEGEDEGQEQGEEQRKPPAKQQPPKQQPPKQQPPKKQ